MLPHWSGPLRIHVNRQRCGEGKPAGPLYFPPSRERLRRRAAVYHFGRAGQGRGPPAPLENREKNAHPRTRHWHLFCTPPPPSGNRLCPRLTATQSRLPRQTCLLADRVAGSRRRGARFGAFYASGTAMKTRSPPRGCRQSSCRTATLVTATSLWVAVKRRPRATLPRQSSSSAHAPVAPHVRQLEPVARKLH
jgi:hypothetical protein